MPAGKLIVMARLAGGRTNVACRPTFPGQTFAESIFDGGCFVCCRNGVGACRSGCLRIAGTSSGNKPDNPDPYRRMNTRKHVRLKWAIPGGRNSGPHAMSRPFRSFVTRGRASMPDPVFGAKRHESGKTIAKTVFAHRHPVWHLTPRFGGAIAQLVEHLLCTQRVRSSNLLGSTISSFFAASHRFPEHFLAPPSLLRQCVDVVCNVGAGKVPLKPCETLTRGWMARVAPR